MCKDRIISLQTKNKFYRIKTHHQNWINCRFPILSAVILRHFSLIHTNYRCGWKHNIVDYILMLKSIGCLMLQQRREKICVFTAKYEKLQFDYKIKFK